MQVVMHRADGERRMHGELPCGNKRRLALSSVLPSTYAASACSHSPDRLSRGMSAGAFSSIRW